MQRTFPVLSALILAVSTTLVFVNLLIRVTVHGSTVLQFGASDAPHALKRI